MWFGTVTCLSHDLQSQISLLLRHLWQLRHFWFYVHWSLEAHGASRAFGSLITPSDPYWTLLSTYIDPLERSLRSEVIPKLTHANALLCLNHNTSPIIIGTPRSLPPGKDCLSFLDISRLWSSQEHVTDVEFNKLLLLLKKFHYIKHLSISYVETRRQLLSKCVTYKSMDDPQISIH